MKNWDPDGQITTWTRQADANTPTVLSLGYDSADQLLSATLTTNTANGAVLSQYLYGYDPAGNRLSEAIQSGTNNPPTITGAGYNNLNQLTNPSGASGQMLFSGSLDKPGTVGVNGVAAFVDPHTTNFAGYASVSEGTNVVQVVAADAYGNSRTNNYQIVVTNSGVAQTITYDLNGNEVSAVTGSSTNTYEWDGADRLTAINAGTNRSEFTYGGLGRRVQIIEKQSGTVVSTKKFVWVGMEICEERDPTGAPAGVGGRAAEGLAGISLEFLLRLCRVQPPLAWVCQEPPGRFCGGPNPAKRRAALRGYGPDLAFAFAKAIGRHDEAAVAPNKLAPEQVQKALPPQLGQAVQVQRQGIEGVQEAAIAGQDVHPRSAEYARRAKANSCQFKLCAPRQRYRTVSKETSQFHLHEV